MDEPCTWRVRPDDPIAEPCANCGHTMLVHGGRPNPSLMECAICTILAAATRLEERRPPQIMLNVTEDEQIKMLSRIRHKPLDHSAGREKPSATVRRLYCLVCHGTLVPDAQEENWVHATPQAGDG